MGTDIALLAGVSEAGVVAAAIGAILGTAGLVARRLRQFGVWLHEVNTVVNRELKPNHGTSMKDQLTAVRVEQVRLKSTVDDHLADVAAHASDPTAHIRPSPPSGGSR